MAKKKIIILGAGIAGLSAAWHLKKKGVPAVVFEKENTAGGLCRSREIGGFVFDYDGHLLHFRNNYAFELVRKLLKGNLARHERSAWIHNFGVFTRYPFQANLFGLPEPVARECLLGFIRAAGFRLKGSEDNFLKWIYSVFGKGIAKHFMVPYNKKFWKASLSEMICLWADRFIPRPLPAEVIDGFFENSDKRLGYNASFWYPKKGGIGQLPLALEKQAGGVYKNCRVSGISLNEKKVTVEGWGRESFDALILTIPLPELIKIIRPLPARILGNFRRLRWNSIFNLNIGVEGPCQPGRHWIYFPRKETVFFRVGFFHNFSNSAAPEGKSSLYAEVSYAKNKAFNREKMVKRILNDLYQAGILNKNNKTAVTDSVDIKYGYPIYDRYYCRATREIKKFLLEHNVITCGRYGGWQYMSMEDALLDGKKAALAV